MLPNLQGASSSEANILLSVVKLIIGVFGNSQAVVADALHSFSDTSSDFVILFGVKYWRAPADDCHPFGHQSGVGKHQIYVLLFGASRRCLRYGCSKINNKISLPSRSCLHFYGSIKNCHHVAPGKKHTPLKIQYRRKNHNQNQFYEKRFGF